jgi:hypothetical protein
MIRKALEYDLEKLNDMLDGNNSTSGINPADEQTRMTADDEGLMKYLQ